MKNYQLKVILAFFIIGSIIIIGLGAFIGIFYNIIGIPIAAGVFYLRCLKGQFYIMI